MVHFQDSAPLPPCSLDGGAGSKPVSQADVEASHMLLSSASEGSVSSDPSVISDSINSNQSNVSGLGSDSTSNNNNIFLFVS